MKDIINTILYSWKSRDLPRTIERNIDLSNYLDMKVNKIIVVTGFRRSGKTYLLLQLIQNLLKNYTRKEVIYINFEDERIPLKTGFLTNMLPIIKQEFGKTEFLFLDEIQVIKNWSKWLRRVYDTETGTRFFVTGSTSKLSGREIPTELRGRFLEVHVYPLNFREFLKFRNVEIDERAAKHSEDEKAKVVRNFNEYLENGGLPEIVLSDKKTELIQNYYNTVVKMDIIEKSGIRNEEGMKALIRLLLNSTHYSISKLYKTLKSLNYKIGKTTVQEYISYIESSYFMYSLPIFSHKVKDQIQYPRKLYFIDNAFLSLSSKFLKNRGRLYENLVFIELKRRSKELYYWLSKQKEEVDFVVFDGMKTKQLIQVCYDISDLDTKKRETRALLKAGKELKCSNLLIITEDKEGKEKVKGKTIKYIPLWKWLLEK